MGEYEAQRPLHDYVPHQPLLAKLASREASGKICFNNRLHFSYRIRRKPYRLALLPRYFSIRGSIGINLQVSPRFIVDYRISAFHGAMLNTTFERDLL